MLTSSTYVNDVRGGADVQIVRTAAGMAVLAAKKQLRKELRRRLAALIPQQIEQESSVLVKKVNIQFD